jgi:exoribonuclease II
LLAIRRRSGTLEFDRPETLVFFDDAGSISAIRPSRGHTRAGQLIENVMIAANGAMSRFLEARGLPSVQRVLPKSDRWDQIVDLAATYGHHLDASPSSASLRAFLAKARVDLDKDVELFRDLCMSVIKLLGRGEYVALRPGSEPVGHFALAVTEYSHSTAPNRRFPDVIVHRMLSAALHDRPCPYTMGELEVLAQHCSEREAAASKLERSTRKSAACILLQPHLGDHFTATVTGSSDNGVYARFEVAEVPAEGRVLRADQHAYRVGQKIEARLAVLNVAEGFIDIEDLARPASSTGRGSATPSGHREGSRSGAASHAHDGSPGGNRSPGQQRHSSLAPSQGEGGNSNHRQRRARSPRHQALDDEQPAAL